MATIKALNAEYSGVSAGVQFKQGIGETSDKNRIEWFRSHGYGVEVSPAEAAEAQAQAAAEAEAEAAIPAPTASAELPAYDADMKLDQLRGIAPVYGVDATKIPKKADIVAAIDAARAASGGTVNETEGETNA